MEMRSELRSVLGGLRAGEGEILEGEYRTKAQHFFDAENVLFYNVGSGCLAGSTRHGLSFARAPTGAPDTKDDLTHYVRYRLVPTPPFPAHPILSGRFIADGYATAQIWAAARRTMGTDIDLRERSFTLYVRIGSSRGRRPASILKSVFDGLISALHAHGGELEPPLMDAIARSSACERVEVARLLSADHGSPLGARTLVRAHGSGVQWNPADDLCRRGTLVVDRVNRGADEVVWALGD